MRGGVWLAEAYCAAIVVHAVRCAERTRAEAKRLTSRRG